jgi:hypothetical protein
MPKFSKVSRDRLAECDDRLQELFNLVIRVKDCAVLCGFRGEKEQNEAYAGGYSHVKWPKGKHNRQPSLAVDVAPWPINWEDEARFREFGNFVMGVAWGLGIPIRWGAEWGDYPHYELV